MSGTRDDSSLRISIALLQEPVVQLSADELAFVIEVVDVPRSSMGQTHDGPGTWSTSSTTTCLLADLDSPERFDLPLAFVALVLGIAHLLVIVLQDITDVSSHVTIGIAYPLRTPRSKLSLARRSREPALLATRKSTVSIVRSPGRARDSTVTRSEPQLTNRMSSNPSGGGFVLCVRIFGMLKLSEHCQNNDRILP